MKAAFATVILSILSAFVGVYSITQLCAKTTLTEDSSDSIRASSNDTRQTTRQKIQQWVNH